MKNTLIAVGLFLAVILQSSFDQPMPNLVLVILIALVIHSRMETVIFWLIIAALFLSFFSVEFYSSFLELGWCFDGSSFFSKKDTCSNWFYY